MSEDFLESDDEEPVCFGRKNSTGQLHGRATQQWLNKGDRFEGHFCAGVKRGRGCFYFSDGSHLSGSFMDDVLEGKGVYTRDDGTQIISQYHNGELHGESTEYNAVGDVTFKGCYKDGTRDGFCITYDEYDAAITGNVASDGSFSGHTIFYIYPDHHHAFVGLFDDGIMVKAKSAMLGSTFTHRCDSLPAYKLIDTENVYKYDPSSHDCISSDPLLPDYYEQAKVLVKQSNIQRAGEGLFARTDLEEGEVVSFYNGIRLTHKEVDGREWSLNGNTISLDDDCVLDVPSQWSTLESYKATLGHKANHSFNPNCIYDLFHHPRFGPIKCIRTLRSINSDEELTCCYDYNHQKPDSSADLPEWYLADFKKWSNISQ